MATPVYRILLIGVVNCESVAWMIWREAGQSKADGDTPMTF
jgi:hypothetical protein